MLGFFVDWNGEVKSVDNPGAGLTCEVEKKDADGLDAWESVSVLDSDGGVIFEATHYPTIQAIEASDIAIEHVT